MSKTEMPFLAIGNEEIDGRPEVFEGDIINFHGHEMQVHYGDNIKNGVRSKSNMIGCVTTSDGKSYVVAIDGKLMNGFEIVRRAE